MDETVTVPPPIDDGDSQYDYLFKPLPEIDARQWLEEKRLAWPALTERQQELFSAITTTSSVTMPMEDENRYDYLFDITNRSGPRSVEAAAIHGSQENFRVPTEKTIKDAESFIQANKSQFDPEVLFIIKAYSQEPSLKPAEIIKLVGGSPDLRQDLARYFKHKIQKGIINPDRARKVRFYPDQINGDRQKSSKLSDYPTMPSQDYASLLSLSLLDGTFRHGHAGADSVLLKELSGTFSDYKEIYVETGQHRAASSMLLGLEPDAIN